MKYQSSRNVETQRKGTINVFAEGKYEVQPDRATIRLGRMTENKDLSEAQRENSAIISKVITSLLDQGITKENIKTIDYRIEPHYQYEEGKQIFIGYKVIHLLSIINDDIQKTGRIVDSAVANGANLVEGIEFTARSIDQFYHYALSSAVLIASQKATTISRTLNVTLDPIPTKIIEKEQLSRPIPFQTVAFEKISAGTPIQTGSLSITANIEAVFQYIY